MNARTINELIEEQKRLEENTGVYRSHRYGMEKAEFAEYLRSICQTKIYQRQHDNEFVIDDYNKGIISLLYDYANVDDSRINPNIGIILSGKYGSGKSILLSGFCHLLNNINAKSDSTPIKEFHSIELTELILENGTKPYSRIPLLIQDIGKEPKSVKDFGNDKNPLRELFLLRCEYGSLTFGTTNYNKDIFEVAYPDFPVSNGSKDIKVFSKRIFEHVNFLTLPGGNRRKNYSL